MRKMREVRPLRAANATQNRKFWWVTGSHSSIRNRKCHVLRAFRKRKLIVYNAWTRIGEKLEVTRQGRKPEWQQISEVGEEICVSNCADLWQERKGGGKGQVLGWATGLTGPLKGLWEMMQITVATRKAHPRQLPTWLKLLVFKTFAGSCPEEASGRVVWGKTKREAQQMGGQTPPAPQPAPTTTAAWRPNAQGLWVHPVS